MRARCENPKSDRFDCYGGRGIRVCDRWQLFENFLEDMGPPPNGYSIERVDVNGHYEPANCKWIPHTEQWKNTRQPCGYNLKNVQKSLAKQMAE
jgi:hypothetical protein